MQMRIHLEKTNIANIIVPVVGIEGQVVDLDCCMCAILIDDPFHIGIQRGVIYPLLQRQYIQFMHWQRCQVLC